MSDRSGESLVSVFREIIRLMGEADECDVLARFEGKPRFGHEAHKLWQVADEMAAEFESRLERLERFEARGEHAYTALDDDKD